MKKDFAITLTPLAAEKMKQHLEEEFKDAKEREAAGIRIRVIPGGCSGFEYKIESTLTSDRNWCVIESEGVKLFLDEFSEQYLNGVTIDFVSGLMGSGFRFNNPNAASSCGCGTSFNV